MRWEGKQVSWDGRSGVVLSHYDGHCVIRCGEKTTRVRVDRLTVEPCEDLAAYVVETVARLDRAQLRKLVRLLNLEVL